MQSDVFYTDFLRPQVLRMPILSRDKVRLLFYWNLGYSLEERSHVISQKVMERTGSPMVWGGYQYSSETRLPETEALKRLGRYLDLRGGYRVRGAEFFKGNIFFVLEDDYEHPLDNMPVKQIVEEYHSRKKGGSGLEGVSLRE